MYCPLWVKSNFSFLEGASHPHELVERASQLGLSTLALTDRNSVGGIAQAHMRAKELGVRMLYGAQLDLGGGVGSGAQVVALAQNRVGYGHLCQLISRGQARCPKGECRVRVHELGELSGGLLLLINTPGLLPKLVDAFEGNMYALCTRHLRPEERSLEAELRDSAKYYGVPTVAGTEVLYHQAARQRLQDVLTCIREGKTLKTAGTLLRPNGEYDLKTMVGMTELFKDDKGSLWRTMEVAERCTFSLQELRYRYPGERCPDGKSESDWLGELTYQGAKRRFPRGIPAEVEEQLQKELLLIHELEYGGYFLTMWEIVRFCRENNILCQGRGSAANSMVCFCLGITAVDPIKLDLLFERFLSRERAEPPDIDLDIEHQRREEVIQWVYQRYGRDKAAMVCNVIRYRTRSAVREVGKTMGLPLTVLDRLSKLLGSRLVSLGNEALDQAGIELSKGMKEFFLQMVAEIRDFPRHLSIHPGGFLLGSEPVDTIVPVEPATMENRTVIQWDKYAVEDLGLFKVDLLGLGALSQVHHCFDLLREHRNVNVDMASIPNDDAATYELISRGDTVGVFQIESRAQMSMLPRLKPKTFYDLVIEVAIVRPGPIQGDMVHPYLKRRNGEEVTEFPHPALERVLKKTLGVPIFQEQVMKIAVLVGGYTPGQADQLRRDMAAWKSSGRIERHRDTLIQNMILHGVEPEYAERVFSQIRGFGEYGFPESHAASLALIAYVTSWLRCHYPAEFACSLFNAQPMGFYTPATIVEDARRHGVKVLPIDVCHSRWDCTMERHQDNLAVRMGLRYIKGLGSVDQELLEEMGRALTLEEFVERSRLNIKALTALAEGGAFQGYGYDRRHALWAVRDIHNRVVTALPFTGKSQAKEGLFQRLTGGQEVLWDYRRTSHSARGHPLRTVRSQLQQLGLPTAEEINQRRDGSRARYAGLVICRQQPGTATGVTFLTLEDETGFVNAVLWNRVFEKYSLIARTAIFLGIAGKLQVEENVIHLIAEHLWEPEVDFGTEFDVDFVAQGTEVRSFH